MFSFGVSGGQRRLLGRRGKSAMQKWSSMYKGLEINRNVMFEKFKEGLCHRSAHREVTR